MNKSRSIRIKSIGVYCKVLFLGVLTWLVLSCGGTVVAQGSSIENNATLYMTEFYKESDTKTVLELYVADVAGAAESVSLSQLGLRSYYRDTVEGSTTGLSAETDEFEFSGDFQIYEGNFYVFIFATEPEPAGLPDDYIYITGEVKVKQVKVKRLASLNEDCALFELYAKINASTRKTLDFIQLGDNCPDTAPKYSTGPWVGMGDLAVPVAGQRESVIRKFSEETEQTGAFSYTKGTYTEADWTAGEYSPALPPDGGCVAMDPRDSDEDGIYDCLEDEMTDTYFGMPLYEWGARTGQRDLFLEIDYMACGISRNLFTQPQRAVLDKIVAKLAEYDYTLHIDTGSLHDVSPGTDPDNYDLGGGNNYLVNSTNVMDRTNYFGIDLASDNEAGRDLYFATKDDHFETRRKQLFYYMVFAETANHDGSDGNKAGIAEVNGNDSLIILHGRGVGATVESASSCDARRLEETRRNFLMNSQAYTIMHEFGHNLNLNHGGDRADGTNYKPNYLSVMNYGYIYHGIPTASNPELISNAYYYNGGNPTLGGNKGCYVDDEAPNNPYVGLNPDLGNGDDRLNSINIWTQDVADFSLAFSSGSRSELNEATLVENTAIYESIKIDYDCSGGALSTTSVALDANFDGKKTMLSDHNDREGINLFFYRGSNPLGLLVLGAGDDDSGSYQKLLGGRQAVLSDEQPVVSEIEEQLFNYRNLHSPAHDEHQSLHGTTTKSLHGSGSSKHKHQ